MFDHEFSTLPLMWTSLCERRPPALHVGTYVKLTKEGAEVLS
jgi:hypothetical protein